MIEAHKNGYDQVLWLDGVHRKYMLQREFAMYLHTLTVLLRLGLVLSIKEP